VAATKGDSLFDHFTRRAPGDFETSWFFVVKVFYSVDTLLLHWELMETGNSECFPWENSFIMRGYGAN